LRLHWACSSSFAFCRASEAEAFAPVEQAILVDTFPPAKRPAAFALYSMAIVTAPVIGPPLGGWITDSWSGGGSSSLHTDRHRLAHFDQASWSRIHQNLLAKSKPLAKAADSKSTA